MFELHFATQGLTARGNQKLVAAMRWLGFSYNFFGRVFNVGDDVRVSHDLPHPELMFTARKRDYSEVLKLVGKVRSLFATFHGLVWNVEVELLLSDRVRTPLRLTLEDFPGFRLVPLAPRAEAHFEFEGTWQELPSLPTIVMRCERAIGARPHQLVIFHLSTWPLAPTATAFITGSFYAETADEAWQIAVRLRRNRARLGHVRITAEQVVLVGEPL